MTGIDVEIAQAIAEKLGLTLQVEDMEFDSVISAVKGGKADMGMAGMTVTEERLEEGSFTESYATGVQVIIVTEDSDITSADDLFAEGANHTIGVQLATTGDLYTTCLLYTSKTAYRLILLETKLYVIPRKGALESSDCVQAAARLRPCSTFYTQFEDSPADNLAFAYKSYSFATGYTQFLRRFGSES